jgi:periplasmic divalent cation tolerance protein
MEYRHLVVFITAPDLKIGEEIAGGLLKQKLAACVNLTPVHSTFNWEGKASQEDEVLLIVKTRADLFEDHLVPAVQALHPYEVPEIIALPVVMGSTSYLNWIEEETSIN